MPTMLHIESAAIMGRFLFTIFGFTATTQTAAQAGCASGDNQ